MVPAGGLFGTGTPGVAGEATTTGAYTQAIARALALKGVDSARVFAAAGLTARSSNDPMRRVPVSQMSQLFRLCVEATGDPAFGLSVARSMHVSSLHALGFSLMASHTLMDFAHRLERHFRMLTEVARIEVRTERDRVALATIDIARSCAETQDAWIGFLARFVRLLTDDEVDPLHVELMHAAPATGPAPYEAFFACPVSFGRPDNVLVFSRERFERPLDGSCPDLVQLHDKVAAEYIARLDRNDIVARVRSQIVERLESAQCDRDTIARELGMAPATLARKLVQRGSSFHEILGDTRRGLALAYLQEAHLPVTEIAFRLGFTDQSNFTRAFKRWTGQAPTAFRTAAPTR